MKAASTSRLALWTTRVRELHHSKFVQDAVSLSAGKGLNLLIGMLSTLIFGIVFTKPEIAVISLFHMFVDLVMAFGINWSAAGVTRFGKKELRTSESLCYTSSTRMHVLLPIVATAVLLLAVFRKSVLEYLGATQPALIWYLIAALVVATIHEHLTSMFTTRERHVANALFYVAQGLGKLLILATFLSGLIEPSVMWFVAASLWLNVLALLIRLPACGRSFLYPLCRVRAEDLRTFLGYVVPQLYGFAGIYVVNWIDVYFIRKHGTMEALGAYQFLYSIFLKFATFAFVANTLLFPRIMAWRRENPATISRFTRGVPHVVLLAAVVACGAFVLVYPPLFDLFFGDKFSMAYPSFTLLICSLPLYFVSHTFVPVLNSFDRVKYVQTVNIISAASNFVVDFILVPRHGIIGAALGTFVAYWTKAILLMLPVHQLFGVRWLAISVSYATLAAFAAAHYISAITH